MKIGRRDQYNNDRCICVTSASSRCYSKARTNMVEEEYNLCEFEQQSNFRAGCSSVDYIFTLSRGAKGGNEERNYLLL